MDSGGRSYHLIKGSKKVFRLVKGSCQLVKDGYHVVEKGLQLAEESAYVCERLS